MHVQAAIFLWLIRYHERVVAVKLRTLDGKERAGDGMEAALKLVERALSPPNVPDLSAIDEHHMTPLMIASYHADRQRDLEAFPREACLEASAARNETFEAFKHVGLRFDGERSLET